MQSAPMGVHTVQFAKDYRAEQIRFAEQSRLAAQFRTPRNRAGELGRAWASTIAYLRLRHLASDPTPTARVVQ